MSPFTSPLHFSSLSLTVVASLTTISVAHATPVGDPLPGPSGLGAIPTTQTVDAGRVAASMGYEYVDIQGTSGHAQQMPFVNLSYGFTKGEVGVSYLHQKTHILGFSSDSDYFTLHGKYRLYSPGEGRAAVAIRAHYYDFGSDAGTNLGSVLSLYGTASYELHRQHDSPLGRLHLGVLGQRSQGPGLSDSFVRPFLGGEVLLGSQFSLGMDYLFQHGDAAKAYTASLRYQPQNKPLSAQLGLGNLRSDTKVFLGLTYSFGK